MAADSLSAELDSPTRITAVIIKPSHWRQAKQLNSDAPGSDTEQSSTPRQDHSCTVSSSYSHSSSDDYNLEQEKVHVVPERFGFRTIVGQKQLPRTLVAEYASVLVACLSWTLVSSATILINKHIMVDLSFHFPAAVAALGMLGTTLVSFLVCIVLRLVPCKAQMTPYFFFTRVFTTGFFMALSFQAGNTSYLYLSVAFVQMLKAFTPVSTMFFGFLFKLEQPSIKLIAAVLGICCGVFVSSYGEMNFSMFGVLAMITSIAAEGLRMVLMQHLLAAKQFHPLEAWIYLGPACSVWLLLLIGVFEVHHMKDQLVLLIVSDHWQYFAFAALAGFAVNALAMLVLKLASALTLKVLGICKDVSLVALGMSLLNEHVTGLQLCGYSISLVGFVYYNYIKAAAAACSKQQLLPTKAKLQLGQSPVSKKQGLIGTAPAPASLTDPLLPHSLTACY